MRWWPVTLCLLGISLLSAQQDAKQKPGSLTLEEVVQDSKANVAEEIIIDRVRKNAKAFDLNAQEIAELKQEGVSGTVIKYLMDPSLPPPGPPAPVAPPPPAAGASAASSPAPPPPPPPPKRGPVTDSLASKVPQDPGVYYLTGNDQFTALALKTIMPYKQPGKLSTLSAGLVKGHVVGSIAGPTAGTRVASNASVFYLRLPERTMIEDFTLLELDKAKDRRDLDFGTKPGKTVFPVTSVKQFDSKEADTGIYRLTVPMIKKGEYFFFILGSADDKKGLLGKGYELGVN
jgi:hypothetical protein